jgi:desulfoferrodoxin (superoxide reductase-like protein)
MNKCLQSIAPIKVGAIMFSFLTGLLMFGFLAACKDTDTGRGSREIVQQDQFTREKPGHWEGLEDEHLPRIKFFPDRKKDNIEVRVYLNPSGGRHYIEKIGLMNEQKQDVSVVSLKNDVPQSNIVVYLTYPLGDTDKVKVFVKCNIHDLWTAPLAETRDLPDSE